MYISCGFLKYSGYQFQSSILRYVFLYKYHKFIWKYQNSFQNQDFSYPDRILVGIRDSQAKSGWLDSLNRQGYEWPPKSQLYMEGAGGALNKTNNRVTVLVTTFT